MNVLVTGANGFVGTLLVNKLIARGDSVRGLVRDPRRIGWASSAPTEVCVGNLRDREAMLRACSGVDVVFHTAALTNHWLPRSEYFLTNVEGTGNLLAAMESAGVPRLIHFSTYMVYGRQVGVKAEDDPCPTTGDGYVDSKIGTEELIRREAEPRGIAWTILRPANIYGPHDRTWIPAVARNINKRRMRLFGSETYPAVLVYGDDVATFAVECSRRAETHGEIFNVASREEVTWSQFFETLAGYLGTAFPSFRIPYRLVHPLAGVVESGWRVARLKRPPPITRFGVDLLTSNIRCCVRKAHDRMGFIADTPYERGLDATVQWMRAEGLVR
jgi:nucleoside-diphosphate-sugar epimerase